MDNKTFTITDKINNRAYTANVLTNITINNGEYCIYTIPQEENTIDIFVSKIVNNKLENIVDTKERDIVNKIVKDLIDIKFEKGDS